MKFNLTVDKRAEAVIDGRLCVNCGKCGQVCPAEAVDEYRRTVYCMFPDCRDENGADGGAGGAGRGAEDFCTFGDARIRAMESGCTASCPLGIVPQTVAALVQRGDIDGAYSYIAEKNPLLRVCAEICEEVCSGSCMRGRVIDELAPLGRAGSQGRPGAAGGRYIGADRGRDRDKVPLQCGWYRSRLSARRDHA